MLKHIIIFIRMAETRTWPRQSHLWLSLSAQQPSLDNTHTKCQSCTLSLFLSSWFPTSTSSRRDGRVLISYLYFYGACRLLWLTWLDVVCCCLIIQASSGWGHKWTDNWLVWLRSERLDYSKNRIHILLLIPREGDGEYTRDLGSFRNPRAVVSSCALHPTILPPCTPTMCSQLVLPTCAAMYSHHAPTPLAADNQPKPLALLVHTCI